MGKLYGEGKRIASDLKSKLCPYCHSEVQPVKDKVCWVCGRHLRNTCTECGHENPNNARYCEVCGAKTWFYAERVLYPFNSCFSQDDIADMQKQRYADYKKIAKKKLKKKRNGIDDIVVIDKNGRYDVENPMVIDSLWDDD